MAATKHANMEMNKAIFLVASDVTIFGVEMRGISMLIWRGAVSEDV